MRVTTSQYKKKAAKTHICSVKTFSPKDNLFVRENNLLEQAAFWHEVEVVCCLAQPTNPLFFYYVSTIKYY